MVLRRLRLSISGYGLLVGSRRGGRIIDFE
jgi:hypothetical protein